MQGYSALKDMSIPWKSYTMIDKKYPCPICSRAGSKVIFEKTIDFSHVGKGRFNAPFLKCKMCNFIYTVNSFMEFNEMWYEKIYDNDKEVSAMNKKRYLSWLDIIEPFRKTNKLFESGFGTGGFLRTAHYERGWECAGNEISAKACDKLSFCKAYNCDMAAVSEDGKYDAVMSLGTIEHVSDPVSQIRDYHRLLRNGGVCFLSTPNINSINRFVCGKEYRLFHPEHLSYFTAKTMKKVFRMNGFSDIKIWTQNIDIYDAFNSIFRKKNISSVQVFDKNQALREKIEVSRYLALLKSIINQTVRILNAGLEMYVIAVKN